MDSIKSIPPMNQVIDKARKIIENPDSNFEELATLIEKDQALAVNVITIPGRHGTTNSLISYMHPIKSLPGPS